MKRLVEGTSFDELRNAVLTMQRRDDKRAFYIFAACISLAVLALIGVVVYMVKKNADDDFEDDWDDEWDDELDYENSCGECCCTDKDVDHSVKVEKL